jgi:hypothetical protein
MMLRVEHQKAREVRERQAPKNGMVEMRPPAVRGRDEIRFEITHGRFKASQKISGRGRQAAWLDEVRSHRGFAKVPACEHQPQEDPAPDQLQEPWLHWPGESAEKHPSTLLIGERHVFRHLPRRPFARGTRHDPLRWQNSACCVDEGADGVAIGVHHTLKICTHSETFSFLIGTCSGPEGRIAFRNGCAARARASVPIRTLMPTRLFQCGAWEPGRSSDRRDRTRAAQAGRAWRRNSSVLL